MKRQGTLADFHPLSQCITVTFQGQTDVAQQCAFTPGGALVASGAAGVTLALT